MNSYAQAARERKAEALATILATAGISEDSARLMTDIEWAIVARHSGVNPPYSQETKNEVYERLDVKRMRRRIAARAMEAEHADSRS